MDKGVKWSCVSKDASPILLPKNREVSLDTWLLWSVKSSSSYERCKVWLMFIACCLCKLYANEKEKRTEWDFQAAAS